MRIGRCIGKLKKYEDTLGPSQILTSGWVRNSVSLQKRQKQKASLPSRHIRLYLYMPPLAKKIRYTRGRTREVQ